METPVLNQHNKLEHEPSHTSEHILNATMVKMHVLETFLHEERLYNAVNV